VTQTDLVECDYCHRLCSPPTTGWQHPWWVCTNCRRILAICLRSVFRTAGRPWEDTKQSTSGDGLNPWQELIDRVETAACTVGFVLAKEPKLDYVLPLCKKERSEARAALVAAIAKLAAASVPCPAGEVNEQ